MIDKFDKTDTEAERKAGEDVAVMAGEFEHYERQRDLCDRVQLVRAWLAVCHDCGWHLVTVNRDEARYDTEWHRDSCEKRDRSSDDTLSDAGWAPDDGR